MATILIPALLRPLAGGATTVRVAGTTLRDVIDDLVRQYPALADRIIEAGAIRPGTLVAVAGDEVFDLNTPVAPDAEVHILPAIAGGA
jgi:molybdopterin converting factor small subunit